MLQYLVILLDDTSVAYCHADNPLVERKLIPIDVLKKAILFSLKENLMTQFVYPDYKLPEEYNALIDSIDHLKIGRDIIIYNKIPQKISNSTLVLRLSLEDFIRQCKHIADLLPQVKRLNICLTDIENFNDAIIDDYKAALDVLIDAQIAQYKAGNEPQINILTDRLQLETMHNCGAGDSNITLAPNGKFYLCPAFYYDEKMGISNRLNHHKPSSERSVGDLETGLQIPNPQLLKLDHAPLCRICDTYHCNRCIWLNQKLTWDNNTPSHQQCVIAHLERNASRDLAERLRKLPTFNFEQSGLSTIEEITYLDPFEVRIEF